MVWGSLHSKGGETRQTTAKPGKERFLSILMCSLGCGNAVWNECHSSPAGRSNDGTRQELRHHAVCLELRMSVSLPELLEKTEPLSLREGGPGLESQPGPSSVGDPE